MSYSAEISRNSPSCFLFLIDQSGSMCESFGGAQSSQNKAQKVADAINSFIESLGLRCTKGDEVRNYFEIGVIGYGTGTGSAFTGNLSSQILHPIGTIYPNYIRMEKSIEQKETGRGKVEDVEVDFPVWFDPKSSGGTPMCAGLRQAYNALQEWVNKHPDSFPPTVINITDGESGDGDPTNDANKIKQLETNDGKVLLCNVHISSKQATPIAFPDSEAMLPDSYAKLLFNISVTLPEPFLQPAKDLGFAVTPNSKAFTFNADPVKLIQFLDIGTRRQLDLMR
ncbi:MAG: vWA domain-containing protein [Microcoleus sp.]